MKPTSTIFKIAMLLICIFSTNLRAQSPEEENVKVMARMDTESFKGKIVLNKAMALDQLLEPFRQREKEKDGAYRISLEPSLLRHLINMAERGDMEEKKKPEAMDRIEKRSLKEVTASNVVPIGIINLDAILLTEEQVQENIKAKSEGKKVDASKYETFELIAAGLLQEEIFQGDVQFQLSKELLYINSNNEIKSVSFDFLDGKGWQQYSFKDDLIKHHFDATGEVGIYIRLDTERGTHITSSTLRINIRERIKADEIEHVTPEGKENGRVAENVTGAECAICNGCDGVLKKPIIIAEGFDKGQDNDIGDIVARFDPYLFYIQKSWLRSRISQLF